MHNFVYALAHEAAEVSQPVSLLGTSGYYVLLSVTTDLCLTHSDCYMY